MTDLPPDWKWTTIGEITERVETTEPRASPERSFVYIDIGGIDGERGVISETQTLKGSEAPSRARQVVRSGDVVLSTVRTYMRKTALVPARLDGEVASTGFSVLRPRAGVDPRYLFHLVRRAPFVKDLSARQSGSSYPAVRDRDVRAMTIPLAPSPEQQRIVAAIEEQLSRLEKAEESLRRARQHLEVMWRVLVRELEQGPRVPLGQLLLEPLANGRSVPTAQEGFPVLRLTAIRDGHINLAERKIGAWDRESAERFLVHGGDFLIARGNGSLSLVGRGGIVGDNPAEVAYPDTMIRARVDPNRIQPQFLSLVWDSPAARRQIERLAKTTAGIYKVNQQDLATIKLPTPPSEVQRALVRDIARQKSIRDSLRAAIEHALIRSDHMRRSLLESAFSGRLVPPSQKDDSTSGSVERLLAASSATVAKSSQSQ